MGGVLPPLTVLRVGDAATIDGEPVRLSAGDVTACAAAYDPDTFEAPLVVGDPAMDDPAYGWVERLATDAGALVAHTRQVDPAFAGMVNDHRFGPSSATFYSPGSPHNPMPGSLYLKHVSFTGGPAPRIPGLRTASFAGPTSGTLTFVMEATMQSVRDRAQSIRNAKPAMSYSEAYWIAQQEADIRRLMEVEEVSFAEPGDAARARSRFARANELLASRLR